MAGEFLELTRQNFGEAGLDRPQEWPELSKKYAKRVGRSYATLFLHGDLFESFQINNAYQFSEVFSESPYAEAHQFGTDTLPARGFMPILNDKESEEAVLTDQAQSKCIEAAQRAIENALK